MSAKRSLGCRGAIEPRIQTKIYTRSTYGVALVSGRHTDRITGMFGGQPSSPSALGFTLATPLLDRAVAESKFARLDYEGMLGKLARPAILGIRFSI